MAPLIASNVCGEYCQRPGRGPPTKIEIKRAIRGLNNGKAPGESQITEDLIKFLADDVCEVLVDLFGKLWRTPKLIPQS